MARKREAVRILHALKMVVFERKIPRPKFRHQITIFQSGKRQKWHEKRETVRILRALKMVVFERKILRPYIGTLLPRFSYFNMRPAGRPVGRSVGEFSEIVILI